MSFARTAKALARRLDWNYINKVHRFRLIRRGAILLCSAVTLLLVGAYWKRGGQTVFSPGRLTSVHAMWDGDRCQTCHTGSGGTFSKFVSDAACLRCHDAAIHHFNQKTLVAFDGAAPVRSASCVSCHAEHRGHEHLIDVSDRGCTQCHRDVTPFTRDGKPTVTTRVTAFAAGQHPAFGRRLTASRTPSPTPQPLVDPTPLRFNHQAHQGYLKNLTPGAPQTPTTADTQDQSCVRCHQPVANRAGGDDRAHMAAVRFESDCAQCHALELVRGSKLVLPHESLELLRPWIAGTFANLPTHFRQELDRLPAAERTKQLVTVKMVPKSPLTPNVKIRKEVAITPDQWVDQKVSAISSELKKWFDEVGPTTPGFDALKAELGRGGSGTTTLAGGGPWTDPRTIEFYATHLPPGIKSENRCNLCHDLNDDGKAVERWTSWHPSLTTGDAGLTGAVSSAASEIPMASPSATQPGPAQAELSAATAKPLATLPTGFVETGRRWFVGAKFDHRAHGAMSCVDCHDQALTSRDTSDVLLPTFESCLRCHHTDSAKAEAKAPGAAESNCLTCHSYHDKSRESRPIPRSAEEWIGGTPMVSRR